MCIRDSRHSAPGERLVETWQGEVRRDRLVHAARKAGGRGAAQWERGGCWRWHPQTAVEEQPEQRFLALDVVVEGALRDTCLGGHLGHLAVLEARACEDPGCGLEDPVEAIRGATARHLSEHRTRLTRQVSYSLTD